MKKFIAGAGGGGDSGSSRQPVEAPDSLRSITIAKIVDALCEGEIEGLIDGAKSVYLDSTPIQAQDGSYNIPGITLDTRTGTQAQSYMKDFDETLSEVPVSVQVETNSSVTRTITNENLNAIDVKIMVPRLSFQDLSNGDTNGTSVRVQIQIKSSGASEYTTKIDNTISGKSSGRYERSFRIALTGSAPWDVRVVRITADAATTNLNNDTYFESYTEVIHRKLRHPNTALVGLTVDSSKFKSIPTRGYHCKLTRVKIPSNYDPLTRIYTGIWDGTFQVAWSDNPAWAFYDMLTNSRYGLGENVKEYNVDKWSLYSIAQYCDEMLVNEIGIAEPRFTINAYIQTRREAFDLLRDMASAFRGMTYHAGTEIIAVQDSPSDPVYQFTNSNIIGGQFSYAGSSRKARHTVAVVSWNDPNNLFQQRFEYIADNEGIARYGISKLQFTAFGCTSRAQAHRVGRWLLYTERLETDTVTFKSGLEGAYIRPGSIVEIMDEYRAGARYGGRIAKSNSVSEVVLDKAFNFDVALAYNLSVILPDGTMETQGILNIGGLQQTIGLSSPYTDLPQTDSVYVISSINLVPAQYRILAVTESEINIYEITALVSHPDKHDAIEKGLNLEPLQTIGDLGAQSPVNVVIEDYLYIDVVVRVRMAVSWEPAEHAIRYQYQWKQDDKPYSALLSTTDASFEVDDIIAGTYTVRVISIGPLGTPSEATEKTTTVLGKLAPPSDVTNFIGRIVKGGVMLTWSPIPDLDILHYEIRVGSSWDDAVVIDYISATSILYEVQSGLNFVFHIRAKDTSLGYSENVTTLETEFTIPVAPDNFIGTQFVGVISFNWLSVEGAAEYVIRAGASWDFGINVAQTTDTKVTINWLQSGTTVFWIKSLDFLGNESIIPFFYNVAVLALPNWNNIVTSDQVALNWPGASINMTENSGFNELNVDRSAGEYYYDVALDKAFDAAIYITHDVDVVTVSTLTWDNADFSWDSDEADIPWSTSGDLSTVSIEHQVAFPESLDSTIIEAFRLDGNLVGENATTANTDTGITYSDVRFAIGADIDDLEQVDWLVTVTDVFSLHFNVAIKDANYPQEFMSIVNGSNQGLVVWYDPDDNQIKFDDQTHEGIAVDVTLLTGDIVFIGVAQTATTRRLFVHRIGYTAKYIEGTVTPVTSLNKVKLYGHI